MLNSKAQIIFIRCWKENLGTDVKNIFKRDNKILFLNLVIWSLTCMVLSIFWMGDSKKYCYLIPLWGQFYAVRHVIIILFIQFSSVLKNIFWVKWFTYRITVADKIEIELLIFTCLIKACILLWMHPNISLDQQAWSFIYDC